MVGYTGGGNPLPTYDSVCNGDGHTEALRVEFDPGVVTYEELLGHYWRNQEPGYGKQYMSAIWYHNEAQQKAAEHFCRSRKTAPHIEEAKPWHNAEDYHQKYYRGIPIGR